MLWKEKTDFTRAVDINHIHKGNASGGGHDICAVLGLPSNGGTVSYIVVNGNIVLTGSNGTKIIIERYDNTTGVASCKIQNGYKTMFPFEIDTSSGGGRATISPKSSFGDIDTAVKKVGDTDPVAFLVETQRTGTQLLKIAHKLNYRGVDCIVINDADGHPISAYPIYPGESWSYDGWVALQ